MHMWKHPQISNNLSQSPSVTVYSWHKAPPLSKVVLYVNQRSSIYLGTRCIMMERVLLLLGLVVLHTSYTVSIHSAFLGRLKRRDWMFTCTSWCVCVCFADTNFPWSTRYVQRWYLKGLNFLEKWKDFEPSLFSLQRCMRMEKMRILS